MQNTIVFRKCGSKLTLTMNVIYAVVSSRCFINANRRNFLSGHNDVMTWKRFPHYWYDVRKFTGPWFNIKMSSYQYGKSHCGDKTVVRSSYLHNGISYTGKMSSLYWIEALVTSQRASDAKHWFFGCCKPEQIVEQQAIDLPVNWATWRV